VTPRHDPDDDDFAVYPFRRQLVEEHTQPIGPAPRPLAAPPRPLAQPLLQAPAAPRPVLQPSRRPRLSPFGIALPLAFAAFVAAAAGAATLSARHQVEQTIQPPIAPVAEAVPKPRRQVVQRPSIFVPDAVGLDRKRAVALLKQHDFRPRVRFAVGKPGRVLEQKPQAATEVKRVGTVLLVVGRAKPKPVPVATPTVIVNSVVGLERNAAAQALLAEGLGVKIFGVRSDRPAGTVVAQAPSGGARADAGSYVRINVAVS
jgi:hypothetical protein